MPTFRIYGARADNGQDTQITVQAETPMEAEAIAKHRRVMVARVIEVEESTQIIASAPPPRLARQDDPWPVGSRVAGHSRMAPTINVNLPKRSSSLGIVSLILGVIALLFCWIPIIGVLSFPIAALGVILASIGFLISLTRGGAGIGWPLGGGLVSVLALLVAFTQVAVIFGATEGLRRASEAAAEVRESEAKRLNAPEDDAPTPVTPEISAATVSPAAPATPQGARGAAPPPPPSAANAEAEPIEGWSPPEGFEAGQLEFVVRSTETGTLPLMTIYGRETGRTTDEFFTAILYATNHHPSRRLVIADLLDEEGPGGAATLTDDSGNRYRRMTFDRFSTRSDGNSSGVVNPGESSDLFLTFEVPTPRARTMTLRFPAARFGGQGTVSVEFDLPHAAAAPAPSKRPIRSTSPTRDERPRR